MSKPRKPKQPKGQSSYNPPATQEVIEERLVETEAALLRRLAPARVAQTLAERWKVTPRQVRDYIREVRDRWRTDAEQLAPDEQRRRIAQRDHMRASLNDAYSRAMGRTEVVRDGAGTPVMDPQTGRPLLREVPDLNKALRAAALLMDLDALAQPKAVNIKHSGIPAAAAPAGPQANIFAVRSADELRHFLTKGHFPEDAPKPRGASATVATGTNGQAKPNGS